MTPRHLRRLLAATAVAIALTGCSLPQETVRDESGAVSEANDSASVFDMAEGDCFDDPGADTFGTDEAKDVGTLPAVPCSDPHVFELFEVHAMTDDEYPGVEATEAEAEKVCAAEFATYVGLPYDDSELELTYLYPTSQSWSMADDREITCLALDPDGPIDGTLAGSER